MGLFSRSAVVPGEASEGPSSASGASSGASGAHVHMLEASDLAALFDANADFVWRSVRRLGVPDGSADDATQQVFMIAQQKITSIRAGQERAFLFRVAVNVAMHARRSAARRREVFGHDEESLASVAPPPDTVLDQSRARALLDEVLDTLDLELRTVFVLCELEELSMVEVAAMLEVPQGTVASRLRRARERFHAEAARARRRLERVAAGPRPLVAQPEVVR